jgi:hypothetical protein
LTFIYSSASQSTLPFLYVSVIGVIIFNILDSVFKFFGKKFSLSSLLVEMVPDPAKNSSKKEYLFKIFENTTLG